MERKRSRKIIAKDRISKLPKFIIHNIMSYLPTKDAAKTAVLSKKWRHAKATFFRMKKKKSMKIITKDRISKLPNFIIHNIMSYLPTKDAAKTAVLSKEWRRTKSTFPILNFNRTFFKKQVKSRKAYKTYVNKTLGRFRKSGLSIQKVRFRVKNISPRLASLVDKWVELCMENHVEELDIRVYPYARSLVPGNGTMQPKGDLWYSLPQTVFAAKSITCIKLFRCKLEPHISGNNTIRFDSLRKLSLLYIQLDEQMIENVIVACPLVQNFKVKHCCGLKRLSIHHLHKLKRVTVVDIGDKIEILDIQEAPSLQSFTFRAWKNKRSCMINMVGCQDLKRLNLKGNVGNNEFFHDLTSKFPLLEALFFSRCKALNKVMIPGLRLKRFSLYKCANLVGAQIDTPLLSSFSYNGDTIPFSFVNAPCEKWELGLVLAHNDSLDTPRYLKLKEFLRHSNQVQILNLSIVSLENPIDLDDLFGISIPPNREVKRSDVDILPPKSDYAALVDGLLQTCRPKSLSITSRSKIPEEFTARINEKLKDKEDGFKHCCSCHQIKCWRHYLEELKAENYEEIEGGMKKENLALHKIRLLGSSYEPGHL